MAPEISTGKYNKPIDIYAIGVILFEMITGRVPFEGETVGEVLIKHLTTRPDLSKLPEPFKTIVGQALAKDPSAPAVASDPALAAGRRPPTARRSVHRRRPRWPRRPAAPVQWAPAPGRGRDPPDHR